MLLEGLAVLFTYGYATAALLARRAVRAYAGGEPTMDEALRSAWLGGHRGVPLGRALSPGNSTRRHLECAREAGALERVSPALTTRTVVHLFTGKSDRGGVPGRGDPICHRGDGEQFAPYGEVGLLAVPGHPELAEPLIQHCLDDVLARGEGVGVNMTLGPCVPCNGLCRYEDALHAASVAAAEPLEAAPSQWALAELVEAGARAGNTTTRNDCPRGAFLDDPRERHGLGARDRGRIRALLGEGHSAEDLYREAIDRLAGTSVHVELARHSWADGDGCGGSVKCRSTPGPSRGPPTSHWSPWASMRSPSARDTSRGDRGDGAQAHGGDLCRSRRSGGPHRGAGRARADQSRDRRGAVPPSDGRVASAQNLLQSGLSTRRELRHTLPLLLHCHLGDEAPRSCR